jgi:hypothetical protein
MSALQKRATYCSSFDLRKRAEDVIWLERRSIAHAFEVEHTTAIYSGLLRMADLLALQPRIQTSLHIVAPASRREQVRREIVRPVFSVLEGGAMAERCSFLSYDALEGILQQPNLRHARETILEDYEEFFDPTWTAGRDFAIENGRNAGG